MCPSHEAVDDNQPFPCMKAGSSAGQELYFSLSLVSRRLPKLSVYQGRCGLFEGCGGVRRSACVQGQPRRFPGPCLGTIL